MAVVSQPFDRSALCEAPGTPDDSLGEFWEDDPWSIAFRHNLSAFERNRTFLNVEGRGFVEASYLTSADSDGDSRSSVAADFNHDGRLDLLVRQSGGVPLLLYENHLPCGNALTVSLRGDKSNRLGIGARLIARVGEKQLHRELYPINTFHSQGPARAHFGVGDAQQIDELTIRWPSGEIQTLREIPAEGHIVITEGITTVAQAAPGGHIAP